MNSFYNINELNSLGFKKLGSNVLISRKTSIYGVEYISIGSNVRIDDYCCLVANERGIEIGSNIHISFHCVLMGSGGIELEDFSGLSSRVAIYSSTDDYSGESLTNPTIPDKFKNIKSGKVVLGKHSIIGTNCTILPDVKIAIGCAIGANSLVVKNTEEWGIYVGNPVRRILDRSKKLLEIEKVYLSEKTD